MEESYLALSSNEQASALRRGISRTLVKALTVNDPEGQHGPCRQAVLDRDGQIVGWKEYRRGD